MGLLPNIIGEQKTLMNKSKQNYRLLKGYMNTLSNELENISVCWSSDAGEKYYIVKQLNLAGSEIASICSGYKNYTSNAERLLDLLKDFKDFLGIISTEKYKFKTKNISKSTKTRVRMDTTQLKECGKRIMKLGYDIEDVELDYKNIANKVDDQINKLLNGKISSLLSLNKRLDTQAIQIIKSGKVIVQICEKYELAEKNIKKKAADLIQGKDVVYGNGTSSNVSVPQHEGGSYIMPNAKTYIVTIEIGGLANLGKTDSKSVKDWIDNRNKNLPRKSEYRNGFCTKYTYDKLKSVGIELQGGGTTVGDGNQWYKKIKTKQVTWDSKYKCNCVDGNNALEKIISDNGGKPVYNIVISYEHAYRKNSKVPQKLDKCGHVMMIDAIINGQVYYSDNYENKTYSLSLAEFKKNYNDHYGNILGAAHFAKK